MLHWPTKTSKYQGANVPTFLCRVVLHFPFVVLGCVAYDSFHVNKRLLFHVRKRSLFYAAWSCVLCCFSRTCSVRYFSLTIRPRLVLLCHPLDPLGSTSTTRPRLVLCMSPLGPAWSKVHLANPEARLASRSVHHLFLACTLFHRLWTKGAPSHYLV